MNDWHLKQQVLQRPAPRRWPLRGVFILILVVLNLGLAGCGSGGDRPTPGGPSDLIEIPETLEEVSPPATIQALAREFDVRPRVSITSPELDQVIQDDRVSVQFEVTDFPAFKDDALGMGPHLHVIVDNEPYRAVYDPSEPLILEDLEPGTHTIRAFASRPWHESFKNAEAYDQTQFHVFTRTPNAPDLEAPLLTYSRPKGGYGAEPVMLDVYLHNAPLHMVAQEDALDDVSDWKIRCTVNGQVFSFDDWEPLYLRGFKSGKNWIQLELLDENDQPISNAYNNTARLITLTSDGGDTLSKLVRGELSLEEARPIIIAGYEPPVEVPEVENLNSAPSVQATEAAGDLDAVDSNSVNVVPASDVPNAEPLTTDIPEPVALPETEAFPPGLLIEETLPELVPTDDVNQSELTENEAVPELDTPELDTPELDTPELDVKDAETAPELSPEPVSPPPLLETPGGATSVEPIDLNESALLLEPSSETVSDDVAMPNRS
ncbi:MAG: hypothetical protein ACFB4J_16285 [Elainellaceae cyanobacterium]